MMNKSELLKNLPTYQPPETVWEAIETRLPLLEMRTYEPPVDVWQSIENQLITSEKVPFRLKIWSTATSRTPSGLRGPSKRLIWLAAASFALLMTASFALFYNLNKNTEANLVVTTEVVDNQLIQQNWTETDKDFALVEAFCETALPKCEEPEFKSLKTELDDLNKAREDLKNVLSAFNSDPEIVAQLSKLENVRSDVLKKIIILVDN
jgi:hypothetical protein